MLDHIDTNATTVLLCIALNLWVYSWWRPKKWHRLDKKVENREAIIISL
jgi:hypothetical protein